MRRKQESRMPRAARIAGALGVVLAVGLGSGAAASDGSDLQAHKDLVRHFTEEVYNQGRPERIEFYVHPDFVDHSVGVPEDARGIAWVRKQYEGTYGAFPDLRFTIDDVIAEGDKVVMRWSSHGTFTGTLGQVEGRGQKVEITGISIFRIESGKIIESWDLVDRARMLQQAGFTLTPPEAEEKPAGKLPQTPGEAKGHGE